jgi:ABC-type uncharacterized transport system permease subunit
LDRILAITAALAWLAPYLGGRFSRALPLFQSNAYFAVGICVHSSGLLLSIFSAQKVPFESMRFGLEALSLWVVLGLAWLRRQPQMEALGTLLLGLAFLLQAAAQLAPESGGGTAREGLWFPVHVGLILAGLGGLALSFSLSTVFLLVQRRLKQKRLAGIGRLPSLEVLDRRNYQSMSFGFVALTAGMAVGGMWGATHPDASMGPTLTIWGTLLLWMWYAAGLYTRLVAGWQGRLAAVFGVGGFLGLALMVGAAAAVLRGWH